MIINRPEYLYQPAFIFKRIMKAFSKKALAKTLDYQLFKIKFFEITANKNDIIGKALSTYGIYDLILTEILYRIVESGDKCIDVGANIGYTTGIMSYRSGINGKIYSLEPSSTIYSILTNNVVGFQKSFGFNNIELIKIGVSDHVGVASFFINSNNSGESKILSSFENDHQDKETSIEEIQITTLDEVLSKEKPFKVLKIDVEGHELEVLKGSTNLLKSKSILNIVFENHEKGESPIIPFLKEYGYDIFLLKKGLLGPKIDPELGSHSSKFEPANYIATLNKSYLSSQLKGFGYLTI